MRLKNHDALAAPTARETKAISASQRFFMTTPNV
jgi:hypothetical protein